MCEIVLFGGTSEGRQIAESLQAAGVPTLVCVASEYGESLLCAGDTLEIRTGRLDANAMKALLKQRAPGLVVDATHPYATQVSGNISAACSGCGIRRIRVLRETRSECGCRVFSTLDGMIEWLDGTDGTIFSTLGVKEAPALTRVRDFRSRVYLRILPAVEGLSAVLSLGYPASHVICMQGPFSREMNAAMFRAADADILITKDSGPAGGFTEKLTAANDCGMTSGVLGRPADGEGVPLETLLTQIREHTL